MQVKVFAKELIPKQTLWSKLVEAIDSGVETQINEWLAANPDITVKNIKQSMTGGSWMPAKLVISIWYESYA